MTLKEFKKMHSLHDSTLDDMKMLDNDFHILIVLCEDKDENFPPYPWIQNNDIIRVIFKNAKVSFESELDDKAISKTLQNFDNIEILNDEIVEETCFDMALEIDDSHFIDVKILSNDVEIINYGLATKSDRYRFADVEQGGKQ